YSAGLLDGVTVQASRYVPATGWSAPVAIGASNSQSHGPSVAMSDGGEAIAVWAVENDPPYSAWASRFVPATGWGPAGKLADNSGGAPDIAMNGAGRAAVVIPGIGLG